MGSVHRDRCETGRARADWVSAGKTRAMRVDQAVRDKPGRRGPARLGQANRAAQAGRVGAG